MKKQNWILLTTLIGMMIPISSCKFYSPSAADSIIYASIQQEENKQATRQDNRIDHKKYKVEQRECGESEDCKDICEDIYDDDRDRDNEGFAILCYELGENTVSIFTIIIDYLTKPSPGSIKVIQEKYLDEFEEMVDLSLAPWIEIAEDANSKEAEYLLAFVASDSDVASALTRANNNYQDYDRYEGVKVLLERIGGSGSKSTQYRKALCDEEISGDETFNGIATSSSAQRIIKDILGSTGCGP